MEPFNISAKTQGDDLIQLDDGRFQLISGGGISPLMVGFSYVLAIKDLASFLVDTGAEGFQIEPATIWRRREDREYHSHERIIVHSHFSSDEIDKLDLTGNGLMFMDNRYLFVTPSLKAAIERANFDFLVFTPGLEGFAAHA